MGFARVVLEQCRGNTKVAHGYYTHVVVQDDANLRCRALRQHVASLG